MAKFADVLNIINGKNQKAVENPNGKYPIYGSGGIMGYADEYICNSNTVIIGRKGSINNPIYVECPFWNVDTAFGLAAHTEVLVPKYLYYFCVSFDFEKLNTTVTIPSLTKHNLLKIDIPLPPLETQRQIAKNLDKVTHLIDLCNSILCRLDLLVKSRFMEMFGDPMSRVGQWQLSTFGDEFDIASGGTPSTSVSKYWENGTISWIGSNMCQNNILYTNDGKYITKLGLEHSSAKVFKSGTVLVALVGATIGKTSLLRFDTATNQNIAAIDVNKNSDFISEYVFYHMQFLYGKFQEIGNGKFKMANQSFIRLLPLMCPPLHLQKQFSAFVEQTDESKSAVKQVLEKAETLKKALMQEYFG